MSLQPHGGKLVNTYQPDTDVQRLQRKSNWMQLR